MQNILQKINTFSKLMYLGDTATISFSDAEKSANSKWLDIDGIRILGNKVSHKWLFFYGIWNKGAKVDYHVHDNCIEKIEVITGIFAINDKIMIKEGGKRTFYKGEPHKMQAMTQDAEMIVTIEKVY